MSVEFLTLAEHRLAYQRQVGDAGKAGVIFLSGFASDMEGTKAVFLNDYCAARNIGYVRFDYRGCGQSSGVFTDGTIGGWLEDTLAVFDQLTTGPQIIVGSSMGGWLGLLVTQLRPERFKAFIGVAAAPDFTEILVWEKLTAVQRAALLREGEIREDGAHAPMTLKLIEEGRHHLIMNKPLRVPCPMRLLQGRLDSEVPWDYAHKIAAHVAQEDVRVMVVENGDHRLSTPDDLALLGRVVGEFF